MFHSFVWPSCSSLTWKFQKTLSSKMKINIRRPRRFWCLSQKKSHSINKCSISLFHRRISIHSEVTAPTAETGDGTEKHILTTCSQAGERLSLLPAGPASPWPYPPCHALLQLRRFENKDTVKHAQCAAFSRASLVGVEALQEEAVKARLAELRHE